MTKVLLSLILIAEVVALARSVPAADFTFRHHFISRDLPTNNTGKGEYGLTALVDLNRDGRPDFVLGGRNVKPERLYWFEYRGPDNWIKHEVGRDYKSDVGLAALDVDGDGWLDLVCSGVWYRNPGKRANQPTDQSTGQPTDQPTDKPTEQPWERFVFDEHAAGAHDVVSADINGDGKPDIMMMSDARRELNGVCWYKIASDPKQPWEKHSIGAGVHGAIAPAGVADINGDGHVDVVRADTWFENKGGKGLEWIAHANIPMGRTGPYGVCVRTIIADMDGDGKTEVVTADTDMVDCKMAVLKNADGKGGSWVKTELPQSFKYGSLHSLAVADFNGDGRPDIVVNEQEELLPPGRENPRWVLWENLGSLKFTEHIILDAKLGGHELQVGDVDGDGDMDICSKPWGVLPWNGANGKMHVDFLENLLKR